MKVIKKEMKNLEKEKIKTISDECKKCQIECRKCKQRVCRDCTVAVEEDNEWTCLSCNKEGENKEKKEEEVNKKEKVKAMNERICKYFIQRRCKNSNNYRYSHYKKQETRICIKRGS